MDLTWYQINPNAKGAYNAKKKYVFEIFFEIKKIALSTVKSEGIIWSNLSRRRKIAIRYSIRKHIDRGTTLETKRSVAV